MYISIQYLLFSFGLTWLCMTVSRSNHMTTNDPISFIFTAEYIYILWLNIHIYIQYSIVYIYHSFFIHPAADGCVGCFHALTIVNCAALLVWGSTLQVGERILPRRCWRQWECGRTQWLCAISFACIKTPYPLECLEGKVGCSRNCPHKRHGIHLRKEKVSASDGEVWALDHMGQLPRCPHS